MRLIACDLTDDKHHFKQINVLNQDFVIGTMGVVSPVALHWGNIDAVCAAIDRAIDAIPRSLAEPNQLMEKLHQVCGPGTHVSSQAIPSCL